MIMKQKFYNNKKLQLINFKFSFKQKIYRSFLIIIVLGLVYSIIEANVEHSNFDITLKLAKLYIILSIFFINGPTSVNTSAMNIHSKNLTYLQGSLLTLSYKTIFCFT